MTFDDHDPLFSEWCSDGQVPASEPFAGSARSLAPTAITLDDWELDEPVRAPVSAAHREKLQRYVKATMIGCVAVCVAAVGRVGMTRVLATSEETASAATQVSVPVAVPTPAFVSTTPTPVPVPASPPVTATAPARAGAPSAPSPVSAPAPSAAPRTAVQERESARRLLERGKIRDALAAAERATTLDATDAEAWLILGAAHQELGQDGAARAAFRSCATSAKRGPVRECRAMLR